MKSDRRKRGNGLIRFGLLLIAAALILTAYNLWSDQNAGKQSDEAAQKLMTLISEKAAEDDPDWGKCLVYIPLDANAGEDGQSGYWAYIRLDPLADNNCTEEDGVWVFLPFEGAFPIVDFSESSGKWILIPKKLLENAEIVDMSGLAFDNQAEYQDYELNPAMDMPEETVDGRKYIGVLNIPSLNLSLPVMSEWDYPNLRVAPCRYVGSAYSNDLVICAHNYDRHFGRLNTLKTGSTITFTDVRGHVFEYKVVEIEVLKPRAVDQMITGDWDLTLFTCTIGGATRVTVRCEKQEI